MNEQKYLHDSSYHSKLSSRNYRFVQFAYGWFSGGESHRAIMLTKFNLHFD